MSLVTEIQQKVEAQEMLILDARKQNDLLKAENAKLRELVRDLVMLPSVPAFDCYGCRYEKHHDCGVLGCKLVERARELGIETGIEVPE